MKKFLLPAFYLFISQTIFASTPELIVRRIENNGTVPGNTYRLYVNLPSDYSLHIVYGDSNSPLQIESTAPFYQHPFAGNAATGITDALINAAPAARFDSWITLGYDNNANNNMWEIGMDYRSFESGGSITTSNGGWFLLPTDQKCSADENRLVLIGQFTSAGVVSGILNLQGWTSTREAWKATALTFNTAGTTVFGCTDASSANFNPDAVFNDGSCSDAVNEEQGVGVAEITAGSDWSVFPNPIQSDLLNIQLDSPLTADGESRIEIVDMTGKTIASHRITGDHLVGKNQLSIKQNLSAGTYKVLLIRGDIIQSKNIVVSK